MATVWPDFVGGRGYYLDTDSSTYGVYADTSTTDQPRVPLPPGVTLLFQRSWDSTQAFPFQVSMKIDWDTNTYTVVTPWSTNSGTGSSSLNGFPLVGLRCNDSYAYSDMTVGYKDGSGAWHYYTDNFAAHSAGWYVEGGHFPGTAFPIHGDVWIRGGTMNYPDGGVGGANDSWRIVDLGSVSPHGVYVAGTLTGYGPHNYGIYGHGFTYYTSMINGYSVVLPPIPNRWTIGPNAAPEMRVA